MDFTVISGFIMLFYSLYTVKALKPYDPNNKTNSENVKQGSYIQNLKQKLQTQNEMSRKSSLWTQELLNKAKNSLRMQAHHKQPNVYDFMAKQYKKKEYPEYVPFPSFTTPDPEFIQAQIAQKIQEDVMKIAGGYKELEKPYVQQVGKNDFLVMANEIIDHHVTVIPNDIFYPMEKPCVNWLAECSVSGLREKLLLRVKGPY